VQVEGLSAHADRGELIDWMRTAPQAPSMTYITHGEPDAADELRARIKHTLGWPARVPEYLETVSLADPR
jgi:metallo-beta-lactamase family protein